MDDDNGAGGLLGIVIGMGLGLWSTVGHGGIAIGLLAVLAMVGGVVWLTFAGF